MNLLKTLKKWEFLLISIFLATFPAWIFLFFLKRIGPNWRLLTNDTGLLIYLFPFAFLSFACVVYLRFQLVKKLVRPFVIIILVGFAYVKGASFLELCVLFYAVSLFFYIKKTNFSGNKNFLRLLAHLFITDGRVPAFLTLLFLAVTPFLLIIKKEPRAEQTAIFAFYFLLITVVAQVLELKLDLKKERLPYSAGKFWKGLFSDFTIFIKAAYQYKNLIFYFTGLLVLSLVGVFALKKIYFQRHLNKLELSKKENISVFKLPNASSQVVTIDATIGKKKLIQIEVTHPFAKPWLWSDCNLVVFWTTKNTTTKPEKYDILYQFDMPLPLLLANESTVMDVPIELPFFIPSGEYNVWLTVQDKERNWFLDGQDQEFKIDVKIERDKREDEFVKIEYYNLLRGLYNDQISDIITLTADSYRSHLEIIKQEVVNGKYNLKVKAKNLGFADWSNSGSSPVSLGVFTVQSFNKEISNEILKEYHFPIHENIHPGQELTMDISVPILSEKENEMYIGLAHEGRTWFYEKGDSLVKIPLLEKGRNIESEIQKVMENKKSAYQALKQKEKGDFDQFIEAFEQKNVNYNIELGEEMPDNGIIGVNENSTINFKIKNTGKITWPFSTNKKDQPIELNISVCKEMDCSKIISSSNTPFSKNPIFPNTTLNYTLKLNAAQLVLSKGDYYFHVSPVFNKKHFLGDNSKPLVIKVSKGEF